jgi:hypothetical protein
MADANEWIVVGIDVSQASLFRLVVPRTPYPSYLCIACDAALGQGRFAESCHPLLSAALSCAPWAVL